MTTEIPNIRSGRPLGTIIKIQRINASDTEPSRKCEGGHSSSTLTYQVNIMCSVTGSKKSASVRVPTHVRLSAYSGEEEEGERKRGVGSGVEVVGRGRRRGGENMREGRRAVSEGGRKGT